MKFRFLYLLVIPFHLYCMEETTPSRMVNNILIAVKGNNFVEVQRWLCRLRLLASMDWKWLEVEQQEKYAELYFEIMKKIEEGKIEKLSYEQDCENVKKEILWLRNKVETDNCVSDWAEFIAKPSEKTETPLPAILKKSRLEELDNFAKTMN